MKKIDYQEWRKGIGPVTAQQPRHLLARFTLSKRSESKGAKSKP